ncbi:TusE/DsrC/DsvC family sulfur relay protein [Pseudomonas sp. RIT-PI-S]|uniref:TusE/DsrC/DsvC family sulfur relay protein n=1 Tax=Pseudomonas sp. RIT-PI-S TaxID=3035295 RepID=UPI0021D8D067|nr:TusE/DsrC/DsvC family sulfur relay protein [Pseudomonas sp. RIT-PI-S]
MAVSALEADGKAVPVDKEGFLVDLADWSPTVAAALAQREGLSLTPAHEEVLTVLRQFYAQFQLSPATRPLVKYVAAQLGPDKGNSAYLNHLFKGTPAKLAAKLAGLPKPANCI